MFVRMHSGGGTSIIRRLRASLLRFGKMFRRANRDGEITAELESHIQLHVEDAMRAGMTPVQARRDALLKLGGVEQTKERYRDQRSLPRLETIVQDLLQAWRGMSARPGFAAVAILTLAVGIGATTAVFSVVDRVLFRSLPYPSDDRLVSFGAKAPFEGIEFMLAPEYAVLRRQPGPFESMTSLIPGGADCDLTEENPVRLNCALVESTFLTTLGIHPMFGRDFVADDDRPNARRVALLSYGLWKSRFASNPGAVGRVLSVEGKPVEIIGVLPANFEMPNLAKADMLLPQALDAAALDRNHPHVLLRAFARLKPSVTIQQAIAGLQPWFQDSLRFVPPQFRAEVSLRVRSLRDRQIEDSRVGAIVLFGAVIAVLLLACTNVANLFLARAVARRRELAIRAALGASRARLAQQTLTESLVLALLGGLAGIVLAFFLLHALISIAPEGIVRLREASLDLRVLGFAFLITVFSGILFGAAPALTKPVPESLAGRTATAVMRGIFRQSLVAAQIGGSVILLTGAGLLLHSLWRLQSVPLGLDAQHVITGQISLAEHRYADAAHQLAFYRDVETRLSRIPGVEALTLSNSLPPSGAMQATFYASIEVPGHPKTEQGTGGMVGWRMVTPNYFPALRIHIIRGRGFTENDRSPAENPVILSEALAAKLFPREDPIGKSMRFSRFDTNGPWRTIVGVAADVKNNGLTANADPEFYVPWKNDPEAYVNRASIVFRTSLDTASVVPWVRSEIAGIDATVPIEFSMMNARVSQLTQRPRFNALLLSLFAAIAVLLAALGLYGVVNFFVSQRTQEIGVRMALGARPRAILRMVLLNVARWTSVGALFGVLGSWFCARLIESLLFGVRAHDPLPVLAALLMLFLVALVAGWVPARRASRVDPVQVLRYE